jgi:hypothetical protein
MLSTSTVKSLIVLEVSDVDNDIDATLNKPQRIF